MLPEKNAKPELETFHKIVIVLASMTFCFYSGMEVMDMTLLPEYLMSLDFCISKSTAALMLSATVASFAASRLIFMFLCRRFNNRILMCMSIALMTISNCLLLIHTGSESMIWISVILMGSGFAPFQAAIFAFMEERVNLTSSLSGRVMFLSAVANVADMLLISKLVQWHPQTFVWINMGSLFLCSLLLAGLHVNDVVGRKKGQKEGFITI